MLTAAHSVAIVIGSVTLAIAFLFILRRLWPPSTRRQHNDIIGWHVGVLGTTYAVILAFMLSGVWTTFQTAQTNAEVEANSLVNVFRLAEGLPPMRQQNVQRLARRYAEVIVTKEWPAMAQGTLSEESFLITRQLWDTIMPSEVHTDLEQTSLNRLLAELTNMTEHRRIRQLESRSKLPPLLWIILIVGGVITVSYSCLFGIENFALHALQVIALSLMISLLLVAVADIDRPFSGAVHVSPDGFYLAQQTFRTYGSIPE